MFTEKVEKILNAIKEKKGIDITVIDLTEVSNFADYFIIATGISSIQTNAIAENVYRHMKRSYKMKGSEGERSGVWILMDFGDEIVHIFQPKERERYSLETLWADGKIEHIGD